VAYSDSTPAVGYDYDRRGRQTTVTMAGTTTSRTFDDANNLLTESYSGGSLGGVSITNGFDQYLRRTSLALLNQQSTLSAINYAYDNASRLQTVTDNTGATSYSATYNYLDNSSLAGHIDFAANGANVMSIVKPYDYLNRLSAISALNSQSSAINSFSYLYNAANQRTSSTFADGSYWSYTYDSLGQVISGKKYWADGTPVAGQQFEYGFDDIGNRKTAGSGGDQSGANLRSQIYTANNLNQYVQRTVPGYAAVLGSANANATVTLWSADGSYAPSVRKGEYYRAELPVNNSTGAVWLTLTNLAVLNNGTSPDIVAATVGNDFLPNTPETFGYDPDGNMTNDGRWSFTWDAENRLTKVESRTDAPPASKRRLVLAYDWQGRRIEKVTSTWNGSTYTPQNTNRFVYEGWNLLAELNCLNSPSRTYMWGMDLSGSLQGAGGVGGLLEVSDRTTINGQPSIHFVSDDGNGNVASLVNMTDGSVSAAYEYGPFGEVIRATGPMSRANPFRFSTKYQDDETDLLYYGYRYYNANTGRWNSRDPLLEAAFSEFRDLSSLDMKVTSDPNEFVFVANRPTLSIDYLGEGLFCKCNFTPGPLPVQFGSAINASGGSNVPGESDPGTQICTRSNQGATFKATSWMSCIERDWVLIDCGCGKYTCHIQRVYTCGMAKKPVGKPVWWLTAYKLTKACPNW
jgi:RHS repeat-associated protein